MGNRWASFIPNGQWQVSTYLLSKQYSTCGRGLTRKVRVTVIMAHANEPGIVCSRLQGRSNCLIDGDGGGAESEATVLTECTFDTVLYSTLDVILNLYSIRLLYHITSVRSHVCCWSAYSLSN